MAYENSVNLKNIDLQYLESRLKTLMETPSIDKFDKEKFIFFNENLNLRILSEKLSKTLTQELFINLPFNIDFSKIEIKSNQLSEFINVRFDKNFRAFINKYRIQIARKLLADQSKMHLSTLRIGGMSGFASDRSFIRAFSRFTGMNPGKYRRENIRKKTKNN
ncbi:AraC family transcriptional regulator [bacterium]|nr:AraC family transcriptional regulator [bacterium]MBT4552138.1 AraC family transcriptional regulator [bacterium]